MHGLSSGPGLFDLGPTAEPVGEDDSFVGGRAQGREELVLGDFDGDVDVARLEAEVSGEAAAPADGRGVDPRALHELGVGVRAEHGVLVAVRLDQGSPVDVRRLPPVGRGEQLGEGPGLVAQAQHVVVVRKELRTVGSEDGCAARFEPDHQPARPEVWGQLTQRAAQDALGDVELAGGDPGQPAAHGAFRDHHPVAGVLEDLDRCLADVGVQVVGEGVRPEHHLSSFAGPAGPTGPVGVGEPVVGEVRHRPVRLDAAGPLREPRQGAGVRDRVDGPRRERSEPCPQRQPTHRVVRRGPQPVLVVVGQELGLVGGHVHVDRAVALAALAGQAQVEGVANGCRAPAVGDRAVRVVVEHLEQQTRPAAGGVLLFAGCAVGGTHDSAGVATALSDTDAAQHGTVEAAVVVGITEVQVAGLVRGVVRSEPQVLVRTVRVDHLAGVHPVVRVDQGLELGERLDHLVAEHDRQQLAALLAVAVLPGQGSAVGTHEVSRPVQEPAVVCDALGGGQVEGDPDVQAAVTKMAVARRLAVAEFVEQVPEVPQVVSQPLRRDC